MRWRPRPRAAFFVQDPLGFGVSEYRLDGFPGNYARPGAFRLDPGSFLKYSTDSLIWMVAVPWGLLFMAKPTKSYSSELGPDQEIALAVTGTAALPSPFPATARVSLLIIPGLKVGQREGVARYFLKSVQVISPRCIVTRTVGLDDVRAIGYPSSGSEGEWTIAPIGRCAAQIDAAIEASKPAEADAGFSYEIPLFDQAVLHVIEHAAVLHRQEYGLTAAVSAEASGPLTDGVGTISSDCCGRDMDFLMASKSCCCRP